MKHRINVARVEDNKRLRLSLEALVNATPDLRCVRTCGSGEEAVECLPAVKPDVVLMDLKMPGIDGDEVLKLLKSMNPSPKVIFITAYDDGGKTKARLLKMGAYACLDKPISSLRDLEETVLKAVSN